MILKSGIRGAVQHFQRGLDTYRNGGEDGVVGTLLPLNEAMKKSSRNGYRIHCECVVVTYTVLISATFVTLIEYTFGGRSVREAVVRSSVTLN